MATFYRADGWVKSTLGPAVSGAQIYVCTQPANTVWPIDPVTRKPVPNWQPTPQAAIYADVNGLQAIQQPLFTDGFGHYDFYALTGSYTVVVINNGAVQQVYPDQSLGLFGLVIPPSGNVSGSNLVSNTIILGGGGSNIVSGPFLTGDTTKFLNGAGVFSVPPAPAGLTLQTNEVPNVSQTLLDLHASTGISLVDNGAGRVTITNTQPGTAQKGPRPSIVHWYGWTESGYPNSGLQSNTFGFGDSPTAAANGGVETGVYPTATSPAYRSMTASVVDSQCCGIYSGGGSNQYSSVTSGILSYYEAKIKLGQTTSMRMWIGEYDASRGAPIGANDFANNTLSHSFIGFRYVSGVDVNWQMVCNTAGTQTTTSTAVAPDTNAHLFAFSISGGVVTFYIDGVSVGTVSTNLPANSLPLRAISSIDNAGAAATPQYSQAWSYWEVSV